MGDPANRADAVRSTGVAAYDYAQVFLPDSILKLDKISELVAGIEYPCQFDLLDILDIRHTMQLDPDANRYTLQHFNCSFFSWTVITLLARKNSRWGDVFSHVR